MKILRCHHEKRSLVRFLKSHFDFWPNELNISALPPNLPGTGLFLRPACQHRKGFAVREGETYVHSVSHQVSQKILFHDWKSFYDFALQLLIQCAQKWQMVWPHVSISHLICCNDQSLQVNKDDELSTFRSELQRLADILGIEDDTDALTNRIESADFYQLYLWKQFMQILLICLKLVNEVL